MSNLCLTTSGEILIKDVSRHEGSSIQGQHTHVSCDPRANGPLADTRDGVAPLGDKDSSVSRFCWKVTVLDLTKIDGQPDGDVGR